MNCDGLRQRLWPSCGRSTAPKGPACRSRTRVRRIRAISGRIRSTSKFRSNPPQNWPTPGVAPPFDCLGVNADSGHAWPGFDHTWSGFGGSRPGFGQSCPRADQMWGATSESRGPRWWRERRRRHPGKLRGPRFGTTTLGSGRSPNEQRLNRYILVFRCTPRAWAAGPPEIAATHDNRPRSLTHVVWHSPSHSYKT